MSGQARSGEGLAQALNELASHRLLPVVELLAERGEVSGDILALARPLGLKQRRPMEAVEGLEARVVGGLIAAGIDLLVLKGTLLAHTVYPSTSCRLRTDMDLLIRESDEQQAGIVLEALGMRRSYEVTGQARSTQDQWVWEKDGVELVLDLHRTLSNKLALDSVFDFDQLWQSSIALDGLVAGARGLSAEHALVHACLHYFGHNDDEFHPDVWLLDMDLLWRSLDGDAQDTLATIAERAEVCGLVAAALELARQRFATPISDEWLAGLRARGEEEWRTGLLAARKGLLSDLRFEWRSRSGIGEQLGYLRRLVFPSARWMLRKYPGSRGWVLPWLYVRRGVEGIKGRLRAQGSRRKEKK